MAPFLSVIVPLYNEESVIREMYRRLTHVLEGDQRDYEIVLVNDGNVDPTLRVAKQLSQTNKGIRLISFSRNFGHLIAITAGMDNASGKISKLSTQLSGLTVSLQSTVFTSILHTTL